MRHVFDITEKDETFILLKYGGDKMALILKWWGRIPTTEEEFIERNVATKWNNEQRKG